MVMAFVGRRRGYRAFQPPPARGSARDLGVAVVAGSFRDAARHNSGMLVAGQIRNAPRSKSGSPGGGSLREPVGRHTPSPGREPWERVRSFHSWSPVKGALGRAGLG